ncbi:MAG: TetR/AcrR family transcriptional regulator [Solirubrobacteraceae bacterium]
MAENQRQRMHGAMVEAVAAHGYGGTSVKQVITLAGVSRRAFYEQFANKQECFLATLELLAARASEHVAAAYRCTDGGIEERMGAALATFAELIASNPKSARMTVLDASAAGPAGWATHTKTLLGFEQALAHSFAHTPGATPLPAPVVRGITGGLHMMLLTRLRQGRFEDPSELTQAMLGWTLAFHAPAARHLQALTPRGKRPGVTARSGKPPAQPRSSTGHPDVRADTAAHADGTERARLIESALEMIALEGYGNLSPLRIVDRAGASIDTFFNLFGDMEGCVLVALAMLADEVRQTLSGIDQASGRDWPAAVTRALHALMRHFAEHPSHAHMIATGAVEMGSPGIDPSLELAFEVARRLTAGAPANATMDEHTHQEGVAGAVWHTVYCHAARHSTDHLQATANHLSYIVLTPYLGAEQAVKTIISEYAARGFSRLGERAQRPGNLRSAQTRTL